MIDIMAFIGGRDVISELAEELGIPRHTAKQARHAIKYGAQHNTLKETLGFTHTKTSIIKERLREKYHTTLEYARNMRQEDYFLSPIYKRKIRFNLHKPHTNFNTLIQGSYADLLLQCLDLTLEENREVELLAHFHDSIYL